MAETITIQTSSAAEVVKVVDLGPQGPQGERGVQGEAGPSGSPGTAATVTVGTVTTGAAGSSASVTNTGTSSAAVLAFTIPRGDKGDKGDTGSTGPAGTTDYNNLTNKPNQDLDTSDNVTFNSLTASTEAAPGIFGGGDISGGRIIATVRTDGSSDLPAQQIFESVGTTNKLTVTVPNSLAANRAVTYPDASGTLALTSDIPTTFAASAITSGTFDNARINWAAPNSIGNTTRNSGAFTTLNANNGTITASAPVLDLSQTWNNAAVTFTGLKFNVTNTASNAASNVIDIQVGGTTRMMLKRDGVLHLQPYTNSGLYHAAPAWIGSTAGLMCSTTLAIGNNLDTILERGGAGIIEQRNGTNAQTYRLYSTYSSATSFERLNIAAQSAGSFIIGTEKGSGGGTARGLEIRTDNTARITISATGGIGFYGAAAAAQPTAVADATDAASVITQLNALLSRMRTIGLIAT